MALAGRVGLPVTAQRAGSPVRVVVLHHAERRGSSSPPGRVPVKVPNGWRYS